MFVGALPRLLCLFADVSEQAVCSIFWLEVMEEDTGMVLWMKVLQGKCVLHVQCETMSLGKLFCAVRRNVGSNSSGVTGDRNVLR
jgi:tRNA(Phe) wybutosine-synthesizing methylase Tyw3